MLYTPQILTQITTIIATGIALYFLNKYATKRVKLEVGGYVEMRYPAILVWMVYLFLGFFIFGIIHGISTRDLFLVVLNLILILIFGFLFALSKQKIRFNSYQLISTRLGSPTITMQWKEIESVRVNIFLQTLVLRGKGGRISISQDLRGYGQFVEMAKEKIPHLVKELNYSGFV